MPKRTAIIRVDASVKTGTGHVMRCIALAQGLQKSGFQIHFVSSECPEALIEKIKGEKLSFRKINFVPGSVQDAKATAKFAKDKKATWVVVDGYVFSEKYQKAVKDAGLRLLFVDDYGHCKNYSADIILNQNIYATERFYPKRTTFCKMLLGTSYVMLRKEFSAFAGWKRQVQRKASKILVSLGGSDPSNSALKILNALKRTNFNLKAIVGGANPHIKSLEKEITKSPNLQILKNVSNMPEHMKWADIIISGGGSTCWETCFMGLPNIILYCAENQIPIAKNLDRAGAAINLGHCSKFSEKRFLSSLAKLVEDFEGRKAMSARGRQLVDGLGVERIVGSMNGLFLRKAKKEDCRFVWELSNSKSVREISFSKDYIPFSQHKKWYEGILKDKNVFFCVAETSDDRRAGQIRFKLNGKDAVVSTSLEAKFRGKGYGSTIIREASDSLMRNSKVKVIHAYIKPDNTGSLKSFQKAGFKQSRPDEFSIEKKCLHFIIEKKSV